MPFLNDAVCAQHWYIHTHRICRIGQSRIQPHTTSIRDRMYGSFLLLRRLYTPYLNNTPYMTVRMGLCTRSKIRAFTVYTCVGMVLANHTYLRPHVHIKVKFWPTLNDEWVNQLNSYKRALQQACCWTDFWAVKIREGSTANIFLEEWNAVELWEGSTIGVKQRMLGRVQRHELDPDPFVI